MNNIFKKRIVTDTLIKAGVKISDKGFYILRDVILVYAESTCPVDVKQKEVFSFIAGKYGLTSAGIQKEIRTPINNAMNLADIDFLRNYFGICYRPATGTVTPQAFILRIVDDVKLKCEELNRESGAYGMNGTAVKSVGVDGFCAE